MPEHLATEEKRSEKGFPSDLDATAQVAIQQVDIEPILLILAQHIPKIVNKLNEREAAVTPSSDSDLFFLFVCLFGLVWDSDSFFFFL